MKNNEIKQLFNKSILIKLSNNNWRLKKNILEKTPINEIYRGVCIESSAFSKKQFALNVFAQPLYLPIHMLILTFGYRTKTPNKREWWELTEGNFGDLEDQLVKAIDDSEQHFFSKVFDANSFYEFFQKNKKATLANYQAVAFSACYAGRKEMKNEINGMLEYMKKNEKLSAEGIKQLYSKTEMLLNLINTNQNTKTIFSEWEVQSRQALKLTNQ